MTKRKNPLSRVRLVYRRSKPLTKMVVTVAIVLSIAALISLGVAKRNARQRLTELQQQTLELEQANEQLQEDIDRLGTLESIQKIAREVLDLVLPGTVFFSTGD